MLSDRKYADRKMMEEKRIQCRWDLEIEKSVWIGRGGSGGDGSEGFGSD
jgi:hypothetical protein